MISELLAWLAAAILVGVVAFYSVTGKPDKRYKYQKVFGLKSVTLGNKSAVIPGKVLVYTFALSGVCVVVALIAYTFGY